MVRLGLIAVIILLLNVVGDSFFRRVDLTKEGRYSLSDVTVSVMDTLDYPMFITAYMEGNFPNEIRAFQEALRTTLLEMKQYGGSNLQFNFEDPSNNVELLQEFAQRGYSGLRVGERVSAVEEKQQQMWPLVVIRYRGKEVYVDLLKGCLEAVATGGAVPNFLKAESDLEYKLTAAMLSLTAEKQTVVGLLRGHGELENVDIQELGSTLQNQFAMVDYNIRASYAGRSISNDINILLVLNPQTAFTEREKYELDQYLMRGGSIFWVMDPQLVDMDMFNKRSTVTELRRLNLDDFFMHHGVKVNYDLIQDLSCEKIEVVVPREDRPDIVEQPWIFSPFVVSFPDHPVTRNVDFVVLRYPSSIDTFEVPGLKHEAFLLTSPDSRTIQGSQFIDINQYLNNPPPANLFRSGPQMAGVMIEGEMSSLFSNRPVPTDSLFPNPPSQAFVSNSVVRIDGETRFEYEDRIKAQIEDVRVRKYMLDLTDSRRMAVISDGDFPLGALFRGERSYMPYDNKGLLLNVIDYLSGDLSLTEIRSKDVIARRLNLNKVRDEQAFWRVMNLSLPVLIIALLGGLRFWIRRRKNEKLQVRE